MDDTEELNELCEDYELEAIVSMLIRQGICEREDILTRLADFIEELEFNDED